MMKRKHAIFNILIICISISLGCKDQINNDFVKTSAPDELRENCFPLKAEFKGVYVLPDSSHWIDINRFAVLTDKSIVVDSAGEDQLSRELPEKAFQWRGTLSKVDTINDSSNCYKLTYQNWYLEDADTCRFLADITICGDSLKECGIIRGTWDIKCPRYNRGGGDIIFSETE
jgi:hypothetical protein